MQQIDLKHYPERFALCGLPVVKVGIDFENIFSTKNIDQDCSKIANLMIPFEKQINTALSSGDNVSAIEIFLQLLASTSKHFVEDEHWCYFDDYYSPDYLCMSIFDSFKEAINAGKLLPEEVKMLRDGLQEVASLEAVLNYDCPSVDRWLREDCFVMK